MAEGLKEIPKRMELVLDRPRSIFYDYRVGVEWEVETYNREIQERRALCLPVDKMRCPICGKVPKDKVRCPNCKVLCEGYERRHITDFQLGWNADLTTALWVMLRRNDPALTLQAVMEMVDLNNTVTVIETMAKVMGIELPEGWDKPAKASAEETVQEAEEKNSTLPTGAPSGPSESST